MADTPGLPPELEAMFPGLGDVLAAGADGGSDRSPPVFMGSTTTTRKTRTSGGWRAGTRTRTSDDIRTEDEAIGDFYSWDDAKVRDFQERAFSAGLYGTSDRSRVRWGDPTDADTFNIWKDRVAAAAGFMNQGRKVTPWDALDLAGQGSTGVDADGERAPFSAQVANPIDMRAALKRAATEVLGGAISDEQISAISDAFQQQQVGAQQSAYNTSEAGGTSTAAPDFGNFAEEQVRALDPIKADSRSAVKVASVIQQMMEGRMPAQQLPAEGG